MTEPVRTSDSDPLQINAVTLEGTLGLIGMTLCPGRKGPRATGGRWNRDLNTDLAAIKAWGPALTVSLVENDEFADLKVPEFRSVVGASSLPWAFAPISDGGVPGPAFEEAWASIGPRVRDILQSGGRVLLHCRAGLGRTGMIAAHILVEFGMKPDEAMRRVRSARPGTIENRAQEKYVRDTRPVRAVRSRADGVAGCLLAAAIGDAIGAAYEFTDAATIERALGEPFAWKLAPALRGSLLYPRKPGLPTDDTALALSVAHVIATAKDYPAASFGAAFTADLARGGRFADMFWKGGPGGATTRALGKLKAGHDPASAGGADDGGNGAAMRAHPVGVLRDRDEVLRVSAVQARVTHGHPAAVAAAQAVAVLVYDALSGLEPSIEPPEGIEETEFVHAWKDAHRNFGRGAELPAHLRDAEMSGWVTVATAHAISFIYRDDPARAIAAAAASGKDTDTVASIVGAIVGARHGTGFLKPEWVAGLQARELVDDAIRALLSRHENDNAMRAHLEPNGRLMVANRSIAYELEDDRLRLLGVEFDAIQLAEATAKARSIDPKVRVTVASAPAVADVLDFAPDWTVLRELFESATSEALRSLGLTSFECDELKPYGGMPSEYRGWLHEVAKVAQRFVVGSELLSPRASNEGTKAIRIAEELVFATRAIAFSMRYGNAAMPYTVAVAVKSLATELPKTEKRLSKLRAIHELERGAA